MSYRLELHDISMRCGDNTVLDGVSLQVQPGGVVVFGGRSGCGKSALLEICAGLIKPSSGRVFWNGEEITDMSKYDLYDRRRSIGYVFQVHALIANHSVFDNIALPLRCRGEASAAQVNEKVLGMMEEMHISRDIESKFPEALSTAQLKSVALARALIINPKLLILDEPLSGMDPFTANTIISVLHQRWERDGISIVMAAHSVSAWPQWEAGRFHLRKGRLESVDDAFAMALSLKPQRKFIYARK
ncbi:MAG: ATP-binding cassette domain-containing protein [Chitinispirillia bacterium]|nr:ATP-binding cassette domain-containing protein [Chitinispirillia bacterium]MCL2267884.1 ATP-binding cassette domain-containing protein [Chitinispirillia bacterium]